MSEMAPEQPEPVDEIVDDEPEPTPESVTGLATYKVLTRQRVDEVRRGKTLDLDPNDPRTARLLARGQIALVDSQEG